MERERTGQDRAKQGSSRQDCLDWQLLCATNSGHGFDINAVDLGWPTAVFVADPTAEQATSVREAENIQQCQVGSIRLRHVAEEGLSDGYSK